MFLRISVSQSRSWELIDCDIPDDVRKVLKDLETVLSFEVKYNRDKMRRHRNAKKQVQP